MLTWGRQIFFIKGFFWNSFCRLLIKPFRPNFCTFIQTVNLIGAGIEIINVKSHSHPVRHYPLVHLHPVAPLGFLLFPSITSQWGMTFSLICSILPSTITGAGTKFSFSAILKQFFNRKYWMEYWQGVKQIQFASRIVYVLLDLISSQLICFKFWETSNSKFQIQVLVIYLKS